MGLTRGEFLGTAAVLAAAAGLEACGFGSAPPPLPRCDPKAEDKKLVIALGGSSKAYEALLRSSLKNAFRHLEKIYQSTSQQLPFNYEIIEGFSQVDPLEQHITTFKGSSGQFVSLNARKQTLEHYTGVLPKKVITVTGFGTSIPNAPHEHGLTQVYSDKQNQISVFDMNNPKCLLSYILTHEVGHGLGRLAHVSHEGHVMNHSCNESTKNGTLETKDLAQITQGSAFYLIDPNNCGKDKNIVQHLTLEQEPTLVYHS